MRLLIGVAGVMAARAPDALAAAPAMDAPVKPAHGEG
jgi:hypothetical protein